MGYVDMISSCNMQEAVVSLWDWDANVPRYYMMISLAGSIMICE